MNVVQIGKEQAIGPALGDQARAFARAAFAANSRRAYAAQWRLWLAHYEASGLPSLLAAPEVVADWIATRAVSGMRAKYGHGGQSVATLRMAIAAIRAAHATAGTQGVTAAKNATETIPIVMIGVRDPAGTGLIASLTRPGGNVTGVSGYAGLEIVAKQLELLKETVPTEEARRPADGAA
jgi:hypothetical protein